MNNKLIKILKLMCITFVIVISQIGYSFADDDGNMLSYNTDSYITDIKVNKDYTYDVKEEINVDFTTPKHGIFRVIPISYGRYQIKDISVEGGNLNVKTKEKSPKLSLKILRIGDKDTYLSGKKKYIIKYKIVGINVGKESDVLRLNLIPTNWNSPIRYAKTTVTMPTDYDFKLSNIYYGGYASPQKIESLKEGTSKQNTTYTFDKSNKKMTLTMYNLGPKEGATIISKLKNNYWIGAKNYNKKYYGIIIAFLVVLLVGIIAKMKLKSKTRLVKTVEFYPPDEMTPAEMGFLLEGRTEDSHLLSSIIYLANKGYVSIKEETSNGYAGTKEEKINGYAGTKEEASKGYAGDDSFTLTKIRDIEDSEKNFIKVLFRAIFYQRDTVNTKDLDEKFADKMVVVRDMVRANFIEEKSVYKNISIVIGIIVSISISILSILSIVLFSQMVAYSSYIILGAIMLILTWIIFGLASINRYKRYLGKSQNTKPAQLIVLGIMMIVALVVLIITSIKDHRFIIISILYVLSLIVSISIMSRTDYNMKMLGRILGFREFLEKVEKNKLEMLVEENPQYFYNILPYTYILGISDIWIKKFEHINIGSPTWYNGDNVDTFDTFFFVYYMSFMNSGILSGSQSLDFFSDSDFSGGGYTGGSGGFSGGGFGGGGGGAW